MKIATLLVAGMAFTMAILHFTGILKADEVVQGLLWVMVGGNNIRDYLNKERNEINENNCK
jgi:hypothetical protein